MQKHKRFDVTTIIGIHQTQNTFLNTVLPISRLRIINQPEEALKYFITQKAGPGYAAIFLDENNVLIAHRVYLLNGDELSLIKIDVQHLQASQAYVVFYADESSVPTSLFSFQARAKNLNNILKKIAV